MQGSWLATNRVQQAFVHTTQRLCRQERQASANPSPSPLALHRPAPGGRGGRAAGAHVVRVVVDERARGQVHHCAGPVVAQVHRNDPAVHIQDAAGRLARLRQPLGRRPPPHVACAPGLSMACGGRRRRQRPGVRCTTAKSTSAPRNCRNDLMGLSAAVWTQSHAYCCPQRYIGPTVPVHAEPRQSSDAARQGGLHSAARQSGAVKLKVQRIDGVKVT